MEETINILWDYGKQQLGNCCDCGRELKRSLCSCGKRRKKKKEDGIIIGHLPR